jgi:HEAT repeat protein
VESIKAAIPTIIVLLKDGAWRVREASADALLKLSEQGKVSSFFSERC